MAVNNPTNQADIVRQNAIPHLFNMLTLPEEEIGSCAAAIRVLAQVISNHDNSHMTAVVDAGCIPRLHALLGPRCVEATSQHMLLLSAVLQLC